MLFVSVICVSGDCHFDFALFLNILNVVNSPSAAADSLAALSVNLSYKFFILPNNHPFCRNSCRNFYRNLLSSAPYCLFCLKCVIEILSFSLNGTENDTSFVQRLKVNGN